MYLQLNDTAGTTVMLGDGQSLVKYHRVGLYLDPPDARHRPGHTDLESYLKDANSFPSEFTIEFAHTGQVI
jgi:hypothetical protein